AAAFPNKAEVVAGFKGERDPIDRFHHPPLGQIIDLQSMDSKQCHSRLTKVFPLNTLSRSEAREEQLLIPAA
ncbi:MAG: hypothetical protein C4345_11400, partial [Chloroflexota bacterium]